MSSANINQKVKEFVRDKLGCKCPNEVFEIIEVERNFSSEVLQYRINVGNRLLIYVVDGSRCQTEESVRNLVEEGVKERDERNFNRFRLVLAMDEIYEFRRLMKIVDGIEKAHIHFVKKSDAFGL